MGICGKLISVIIPVYNAEKFIRKCVDSILSQTYRNIEIILVDDGSKDQSFEICKKYSTMDSRIFAYTKPNGGQASARNYALDRAHGDYIAFVDDDDWCDEKLYEHLLFFAEKYNADIVSAKEYTGSKGTISEKYIVYTMNEYAEKLLPDEIGSHVLAKLFKKELFDEIRFPFSRTVEDMRLFTKIIEKVSTVVQTEAELYRYSIHENNTSFVYSNTPSSSLDRAEAFIERYQLTSCIAPAKLSTIVCKSVTFGLGGISMINTCPNKYDEQVQLIEHFFKIHKGEIMNNNEIDWKRKIAVLFVIHKIHFPLTFIGKIRRICRRYR